MPTPTENPIVMLLVRSENATDAQKGFMPKSFPYEQAKGFFAPKYRGRFKLDPKEKNYKLINGDLIKQSTGG